MGAGSRGRDAPASRERRRFRQIAQESSVDESGPTFSRGMGRPPGDEREEVGEKREERLRRRVRRERGVRVSESAR